jgi:hypothetical protein
MTSKVARPAQPRSQGVKLAITVAAVAATLGGWVALAPRSGADSTAVTVPAAATAGAPAWLAAPPPIPTLAPVTGLAEAPRRPAVVAVPAPRPAPLVVTRSSR